MRKVIIDTNVLLDHPDAIKDFEVVVVPMVILEELVSKKRDRDLGYKARKVLKMLEEAENVAFIEEELYDNINDNKIINSAKEIDADIISNDIDILLKSRALGLMCENYTPGEFYRGWKEVILGEDGINELFRDGRLEGREAVLNQYLVLLDDANEPIDTRKVTLGGLTKIPYKASKSRMLGVLKPKDRYQEMALDSLYNEDFTILTGRAGSGKTLLSLSYAFDMIEARKYRKLIVIFNPTPVKNSQELGYNKGSKLEKILQSAIAGVLACKLGGEDNLLDLIERDVIEIIPLCNARGIEIPDDCILYFTEAQNLNVEMTKLIIQRAAEGTKIIMEGDIDTQIDKGAFEGANNGLVRAIEVFKGYDNFSTVYLPNIYRSKLADRADLM